MCTTFDAACDVEEVVLVVFAQVSGMQPAVRVQRLLRLVGHVQVAHEDVAAPEADLAVFVRVGVKDLRLAAGDHLPAADEEKRPQVHTDVYNDAPVYTESFAFL